MEIVHLFISSDNEATFYNFMIPQFHRFITEFSMLMLWNLQRLIQKLQTNSETIAVLFVIQTNVNLRPNYRSASKKSFVKHLPHTSHQVNLFIGLKLCESLNWKWRIFANQIFQLNKIASKSINTVSYSIVERIESI